MPFSPATALFKDDDEELNARRALWKETWREILPAGHVTTTEPTSAQSSAAGSSVVVDPSQPHFCLSGTYSGVTASSNACPLADLLKPPLLATFVSTLSEALIKSQSWFVRSQAALALLSVSAAIVSQPMFLLTTVASSMMRDANPATTDTVGASLSSAFGQMALLPAGQQKAGEGEREGESEEEVVEDDEGEEIVEDEEDDVDDDEDDDEPDEEENEAVFLIWCELARVLLMALKETGTWSGKVSCFSVFTLFDLAVYRSAILSIRCTCCVRCGCLLKLHLKGYSISTTLVMNS